LIHDIRRSDPRLAVVNDAWPDLPEAVKAGIVAMVKSFNPGEQEHD
jgi:hypothetical protein